jgi:phosphoenolpyruvate carboxykinase (ATP)
MPIKATRALLTAALDGSLAKAEMRVDACFGLEVPLEAPGVDSAILTPRETWADKQAYDAQASRLARMFVDNFAQFESHVDADVRDAAPVIRAAAE